MSNIEFIRLLNCIVAGRIQFMAAHYKIELENAKPNVQTDSVPNEIDFKVTVMSSEDTTRSTKVSIDFKLNKFCCLVL